MERMRSYLRLLVLALTAALGFVPVISCKTPSGTGLVSKVVDCASRAVREKGLVYIGKVNDVLGSQSLSDPAARAKLVDLGIDAGQDVLGCLLLDQGQKFAEATAANPNDKVSQTAARRAKERVGELEAEGWQFNR